MPVIDLAQLETMTGGDAPLPAEAIGIFRQSADLWGRMLGPQSEPDHWADAAHGINIKLSKCGGLAEARRMAHEAHRAHLTVMLGCMIESSLGISAMAQLAPLADYADLDGAALLSDDPFEGVSIEDGFIKLSDKPGLGVSARKVSSRA